MSSLNPFFVLLDLFAQPANEDDGLFGGADGPFKKTGGLFSGGGGLFDDNDQVHAQNVIKNLECK